MGRLRSKSTGCQSKRSESQHEHSNGNDDDELYVPGSGGIYITRTKGGKPAFGRKKESLLRDWGFDSFGYVFGIPSYKELERSIERQTRRRASFSSQSQSSALTTPSSSSRIFTPRGRPSKRSYSPAATGTSSVRSHSSIPTTISKGSLKSSLRSSSTSTPARSCRRGGSKTTNSDHGGTPEARNATISSGLIYPPTPSTSVPASPSHPLPLLSNLGNSLSATPNVPITPAVGNRGLAIQSPNTNGLLFIPLSHHYAQPPVFLGSQPTSIPSYFQHSQPAVQQTEIRSTYPISGPVSGTAPLPTSSFAYPPFPPSQLRGGGGPAVLNNPLGFSFNEAKKCEEHYNAVLKADKQETENNEGKEKNKKGNKARNQEGIGKHIQHVHFCAGCGRMRSKGYQKTHPLERGQIPQPDYCAKCLRDAALMEYGDTGGTSIARYIDEDTMSATGTDAPGASPSKKEPKNCRTCKWLKLKKPRRLSFLSGILSNSTASEYRPRPPSSVSSTGEPESKVSDSVTDLGIEYDRTKYKMSSAGGVSRRIDDSALPLPSNMSRRSQKVHSSKDKGLIPKSDVYTTNISEPARETLRRTAQVFEPDDSSGDIYNTTPPKVPTTGGYSKTRRQDFPKFPHKDRPKAFVQSVSDYSEETDCLDYKVRNETYEIVDEDYRCASASSTARETSRVPYSKAHRSTSSSKEPNRGVHSWNDTYGSTYEHQQTAAHTMTESEQPIRDSELGWRKHSDRRRIRRHQDERGHHTKTRYRGARESYIDRSIDTELDTPDDPNHTFKWDLPPTPTDIPYAGGASGPYFMREPWGISEEDMHQMEREAEELAEKYLASAGKLFSNMTTTSGDSSPSKIPIVTCTEFSIGTYDFNEELDPNVPTATMFELVESSDTSEIVDQEERSAKTLTFFGEGDLDQKAPVRTRGPIPSTDHASRGPRGPRGDQAESSKKASKKNANSFGVRELSSSSNLPSLNAQSSMVVHTGHSAENMRPHLMDYTSSTVPGRRRRIRRPSCT
ncbi:hypothetical protein F5Y13DRAFT_207379 [Hypoxylon sp. FL1857]|nr:hypothetical protein F5Y13DRAFT_207379 [Hypoxylon sp. FL1857]